MYMLEATHSLAARQNDSANIGPTGLGVIWMVVFLTLSIVFLRFYTQLRITRQFGLSDYLMIASIAVMTSFASLITVQYQHGWGRHQSTLGPVELQQFLKINVVSQPFGIMGSTFGRMSFIAFMIRLFGSANKRLLRFLWIMFALQLLTNGLTVICIYVSCHDVRALYNFALAETTKCWPDNVQTKIGYAHTSFNALTDLILTVVPVVMIWNLQLKTRVKMTVAVLLSMSCVAFVGVIMKIVYLNALSHRGDATYNTVPMFSWITVETGLVDMAASVPLLRPLFKTWLGDPATHMTPGTYELSHGRRGGGTGGLKSGVSASAAAGRGGTAGGTVNSFGGGLRSGGQKSRIRPLHGSLSSSLGINTFSKLHDGTSNTSDGTDDGVDSPDGHHHTTRYPSTSSRSSSEDKILAHTNEKLANPDPKQDENPHTYVTAITRGGGGDRLPLANNSQPPAAAMQPQHMQYQSQTAPLQHRQPSQHVTVHEEFTIRYHTADQLQDANQPTPWDVKR